MLLLFTYDSDSLLQYEMLFVLVGQWSEFVHHSCMVKLANTLGYMELLTVKDI